MSKILVAAVLAVTVLTGQAAQARGRHPAARLDIHQHRTFLTGLDHDGTLSAGWIDVLPALASTCNLKLDNGELTARLIDLSRNDGNLSYTRDLYTTLYLIEKRRAKNDFVQAWTARFDGRPQEACDMAETLWGNGGRQFPGVLKREAAAEPDAATQAPNCK